MTTTNDTLAEPDLIERLSNEADLCRNDGADDIAKLLDEAVSALTAQAPAVGEPKFDVAYMTQLAEESQHITSLGTVEYLMTPIRLAYVVGKLMQVSPLAAQQAAQAPVGLGLSREDIDLCRQWFDNVQDVNGGYLEQADYVLAEKLYKHLGMRVPHSVSGPATRPQPEVKP